KGRELRDGVGILPVLLEAAAPELPLTLEEIHAIVADALCLVKLRPPHAVALVVFVQKDLAVQPAELFFAVDVEGQNAAVGEALINAPQGFGGVPGVGEIVETVQAA